MTTKTTSGRMTTEEQLSSIEKRLTAIENLLRKPAPVAVSVPDAAKMLGVSAPTVYNLIHSEGFPCIAVGSRRLVSVEALQNWVGERVSAG